ncbi:MAG: S-layer homology domain-containing protein [Firmicutes bacterium]|nr:S-layer homology domain-containing protein [Bacillota bacterium]
MKNMRKKGMTRIALIVMVMALLVGFSLPLAADDYPGTAIIVPADPKHPEVSPEFDWTKYLPEDWPGFDMITGTQGSKTDINTVISFGEKEEFVYNGSHQAPKLNQHGKEYLQEGFDYEIMYAQLVWDENSDIGISAVDVDSCVNAGYYLMTVFGMGDYRGSVKDGEFNQRFFVINQADSGVNLTLPASVDAVYGQTMKDIPFIGMTADQEGTFSWPNPDFSVGDVGNQQRVVVFTPKDRNYKAERKEVTLNVAPKELTLELVGTAEKVYDGTTAVPEDNGLGFAFDGMLEDDVIFVDAASYQYASAEVGGNIEVTAKGLTLDGEDAANYKVASVVKAPVGIILPVDIDENAWYYDGVGFCISAGLMVGVGDGLFLPDGNTTRAQVVMMLWRLAGSPIVDGEMPFDDVADGAWYEDAVRWAESEGIVMGISEDTFAPDDLVTREQLVTMIYRFAKESGMDVSVGEDTNILSYADAETISEWAMDAMQWAVGSDLIEGRGDGILAPKENCTRAELATVFYRYVLSMIGEA